jgi:hypothetical protein
LGLVSSGKQIPGAEFVRGPVPIADRFSYSAVLARLDVTSCVVKRAAVVERAGVDIGVAVAGRVGVAW